MSIKVGELYAELKLNQDHFSRGLTKGRLSLAGFGKAVLGLSAVVAGGLAVAFDKAVAKSEDFYRSSLRVSAITGMNIEKSSQLVAVLEKYGLEGDKIIKTVGLLQKNVGVLTSKTKTETAFTKLWGFSLRDANGRVKSASALILQAANYFTNKHIPATKRAALESKLFGRQWQDLVPILSLGSKGILAAEAAAKALGLTLNASNAKDLEAYRQSTIKLHEAMAGLLLQMALLVIPALVKIGTVLSEQVIPAIRRGIGHFKDWLQANRPLVADLAALVDSVVHLGAALAGGVVTLVARIAKNTDAWYRANKPLVDQFRAFGKTTWANGLKVIGDVIGKIAGSKHAQAVGVILGVAGALSVLNAVLRANPIIAAISGIILAVGLLKDAWDADLGGIREIVATVAKDIGPTLDKIGTIIGDITSGDTGKFAADMKALGESAPAVATFFQVLSDGLAAASTGVADLQAGVKIVGDAMAAAWPTISAIVMGAVNAIGGALQWLQGNIFPPIQAVIDTLSTQVFPGLQTAMASVTTWVQQNWPLISSVFTDVSTAVQVITGAMIGTITDFVTAVAWGADQVAKLLTPVGQVVFPLVGAAASALLTAIDISFKAIEVIIQAFRDGAGAAFDAVKYALGLLGDMFAIVFSAVGVVVQTLVDAISAAFTVIGSSFDEGKRELGLLGDAFAAIFGAIASAVSSAMGIAAAAIQHVIDLINAVLRLLPQLPGDHALSSTLHIPGASGGGSTSGTYPKPPPGNTTPPMPSAPPPSGGGGGGGKRQLLASGTPFFAGGLAMTGEYGPELARLPRGTAVSNAAQTRAWMRGSAGASVTIEGGIHLHGVGSDVSPRRAARFAQQVIDVVAEGLQEQNARLTGARAAR